MNRLTLTSVPGIRVGHWTDRERSTGCSVIVLPEPNIAAAEVRGGAPGSRETALLAPGMTVQQVQAILLTGGSAFGLAAADGVMQELEGEGRGHPTPAGPVPIVPAAVVYDLWPGDATARPGAPEGAAAYRAAHDGPVEIGLVGAGTGATCAKWRGVDQIRPGGLGSAGVARGAALVGALAVINAVGDVFTLEGEPLTGGPHVPGPSGSPPPSNTTLVVVATDAALDREQLSRLMVRAHDALAVCVRPAHTRFDGDIVFAVSCGDAEVVLDDLAEGAFEAVGRSVEAAVRAASSDQEIGIASKAGGG